MASESERLSKRLRMATNRANRASRLATALVKARVTIHLLRRRIKTLKKAMAEREISLSLAMGTLRRASHLPMVVDSPLPMEPQEALFHGMSPRWEAEARRVLGKAGAS